MAKASTKAAPAGPDEQTTAEAEARPTCGIIMPISAIPPDYDATHWGDVRRILDEAIEAAEMQPQIVSDSFETDVIQRRIVHNLYENPVVVCDVSGLNPNVMFELGMRLTFKKPVIIITDDVKRIPFDTGIIEHLEYPRDLHIHKTKEFMTQLTDRIRQLHDQLNSNQFKPFIETFGTFQVFEPSVESVSGDKFIADRLDEITRAMRRLERRADAGDHMMGVATQSALAGLKSYSYHFDNGDAASLFARRAGNLKGIQGIGTREAGNQVTVLIHVGLPAPAYTEAKLTDLAQVYGGRKSDTE